MKKITESERRIHPRLAHRLPFKVVADGYDFTTTTQNISCVGAYCHIDKYVPPFTRVMIKLDLPINATPSGKSYKVECKGVIVRSEDEDRGGFNVAIFFNAIRNDQRKIISRYINQFLPKEV
ncbi:MAG: PilZ domain-containing protein [Candidatus Omnitrophota bacterium]|nr:PilZ domain-containing protein [Candidatus Omnitrophota bacterium]